MAVKRMDNVGIVVENLDAAIAFFTELGLTLEGRAPIEGIGPAMSPAPPGCSPAPCGPSRA